MCFKSAENDNLARVAKHMINILKAPYIRNADSYEIARFKLTWNVNLFLCAVLLTLGVVSTFGESYYVIYYALGFAMTVISLLFLKFKREYKGVAFILSSLMYGMIVISMFSLNGYVHYMEPFWAIVITLYIYFIRGKTLGTLVLLLTILTTTLFFVYRLNDTVRLVEEMSTYRLLNMSFEFAACLTIIGYLVHQFINSSLIAEKELKRTNLALQREKKIVEKQNKEKTILLQEIHHRVKNNLQIVTSLLRMQADKINSEEAKVHFQDAVNRVLTMSLIHQKLYENENLSEIDLSEYVESLCKDILRINDNSQQITQDLSIDCQQIGSKTLVPLGLIITELISNSVKHAFKENTSHPTIRIEITLHDSGRIIKMIYADNGTWREVDKESFGLQLIETFTEQLEGSFSLEKGSKGTVYVFELQNLDKMDD